MHFFTKLFLSVRGVLAQKIKMHTIFRKFSDVINRGQSQQRSVLGQLVTGESSYTGIIVS